MGRKRERENKREKEININVRETRPFGCLWHMPQQGPVIEPATQVFALDWVSKQDHSMQADALTTVPYQPRALP